MTATAASAGLVDALKDSLANSVHAWSVLAASDVDGLSVTLAAAGLLQGGDATRVIYRTPAKGPRVIFLKSGSTWTVPDDWDSASNTVEVLGGGGGGGNAGCGGGGGGAYSKISNLALAPGATVSYAVGAAGAAATAGGDTHFDGAAFGTASVAAKGGAGTTTSTGGAGGAAASGTGSLKYSGGTGGNGQGGGGGGSAGPDGNGGAGGNAFGGGGGANGGGNASGNTGGHGVSGSGGGTRTSPARNGGGGVGGGYSSAAGNGSQQSLWLTTDAGLVGSESVAGPGGGGGGAYYYLQDIWIDTSHYYVENSTPAKVGGWFGGGGGGGSAGNAAAGAPGAPGIIVITYGSSAVSQLDFGGAQYTVSDSALDTTIKVLAAAFLADTDDALTDLFTTGVSSGGGGSSTTVSLPASVDLIAALKASLADTDAHWSITGSAVNVIREAKGQGGTSSVSTAVSRIDHVVTLSSPLIRVAVGARAPLAFCYIGSTTPAGVYTSSEIYIDGKLFTVADSVLHDLIMDLAEAERLALDAAVTDSLALGPQTFGA